MGRKGKASGHSTSSCLYKKLYEDLLKKVETMPPPEEEDVKPKAVTGYLRYVEREEGQRHYLLEDIWKEWMQKVGWEFYDPNLMDNQTEVFYMKDEKPYLHHPNLGLLVAHSPRPKGLKSRDFKLLGKLYRMLDPTKTFIYCHLKTRARIGHNSTEESMMEHFQVLLLLHFQKI